MKCIYVFILVCEPNRHLIPLQNHWVWGSTTAAFRMVMFTKVFGWFVFTFVYWFANPIGIWSRCRNMGSGAELQLLLYFTPTPSYSLGKILNVLSILFIFCYFSGKCASVKICYFGIFLEWGMRSCNLISWNLSTEKGRKKKASKIQPWIQNWSLQMFVYFLWIQWIFFTLRVLKKFKSVDKRNDFILLRGIFWHAIWKLISVSSRYTLLLILGVDNYYNRTQ